MASSSNNPSALLEEDSNAMMDTLPLAESTLIMEGDLAPLGQIPHRQSSLNANLESRTAMSLGGLSTIPGAHEDEPEEDEEDEDEFPEEDDEDDPGDEDEDDEEDEDAVEDEEDSLLEDMDDESMSMTTMNVGDVTLGTDFDDSLMGGEDDEEEEEEDDDEEEEEGNESGAPEDVWKDRRILNPALKAVVELTTDSATNSGGQSPASSTPDPQKEDEADPEPKPRKKRGRPSRAEMARRAKAREEAGETPVDEPKKTRRRTNPKKVELDENGQPVVKRRGRKPMPPEVKARIKEEKRLQKIEERKQKRLKARRDRGEDVESSGTGKKRQRGRRAKVLSEEELAERERIRKQKYEEFKQQKREKAQQRLERNAALREFRKKKKEEEKKQREEYEKRMQNLRASFLDENSHMSAGGAGEESILDESSMQSAGGSKLPRWAMGNLELSQLKQIKQVSAETLFEYCWPPGGKISEYYFLQEQVTEYLAIKSFKRKYPHCLRRNVEAEERDFLVEMKIVNETQADLGLTAIPATQVLDIMSQDFYDKYDVYMTVKSERKDRMNRQTNYSTVTIEKHKFADFVEKAVQSASDWNKQLNQEKREKRRAYFDMQTFIIQRPMNNRGRMKVLPTPKLGNYPVALIPGQFDKEVDEKEKDKPSADDEKPDKPIGKESLHDNDNLNDSLTVLNILLTLDAEVPGATCKICTGDRVRNKIGQPEKLLHCSKCSQSCHPTCAGLTLELLEYVTKYKWMCTECKVCSLCQDHSDEEKMLFCDLCDRGYHTYCVGLDTIPSGRWQCGKCTVCSSCNVRDPPGTNVLQSEHRWVYEFKTSALTGSKVYSHAMCKPCHRSWKKGSFCPECTVVFGREPDKAQEEIEYYNCWVCTRPHHSYCVGQATFICGFCQKKTLEKSLGSGNLAGGSSSGGFLSNENSRNSHRSSRRSAATMARNANLRDFSEPAGNGAPTASTGLPDRSTSQSTAGYSRRASLEYQPVTCDVCQKVYKNKSTLYSHKNRDHGVKSSIK
ncbi:hypothetical protein TCAL_01128 [Tigriopus californicus]|uniref:PHD-type domain-containing protein n=1 Tax=Tigriopus californicus TaxID=6832 RepID=A0A553P2W5_TIGCA|nr:hypothetical protein TCAL_01128 [Tigriopus californicus]